MILTWDRIFQIIGYILGSLLYFLAGILLEKLKEKRRRKETHFVLIKNQVFEPALSFIETKYTPVLSRKYLGIEVETTRIYEESGMDQKIIGRRFSFHISEENFYLDPVTKGLIGGVNPYLYEDVKSKHYKKLGEALEQFKNKYKKYLEQCSEEAEKIAELLHGKLGYSRETKDTDQKWINICELAKAILGKRLSIDIFIDRNNYNRGYQVSMNSKMVANGLEQQDLEKLNNTFKELSKASNESEELIKRSDILIEELIKLKDEINQVIISEKLEGKCDYA